MPCPEDDIPRWRWDPRPNGYVSLVQPVALPNGTPAVLKLGWPHKESEHEWLALSSWDDDGAVRRLDLLVEVEELEPDRARAWTFVHAVANRADGEDRVDDTCQVIATALASH
jgi:Aminoglycoside/hydroxyurea antibiotic resistance kinase